MTTPRHRRRRPAPPARADLHLATRWPRQVALGGVAAATLSTGLFWSLTTALLVLALGSACVFAFAICTRRSEPWQRLVQLVRLLKCGPQVPTGRVVQERPTGRPSGTAGPPPTPRSAGGSAQRSLDAARNSR
jgi:hypothetical protein